MITKDIHSECQRCANLKAWNIHMNGEHYYCCRCKPSGFISEVRWEPCEKFEERPNEVLVEFNENKELVLQANNATLDFYK